MKTLNKILLLLLLSISLTATAAHRSTSEEAKALFDKAVTTYQSEGKVAAAEKFNQKKGEFNKGDLYIFAFDEEGNYLASGHNPGLVGKPAKNIVDASGKNIYEAIINELAKNKDVTTVDYVWLNKQTNQVETKTSYVKKVDGVIIGLGFYH